MITCRNRCKSETHLIKVIQLIYFDKSKIYKLKC